MSQPPTLNSGLSRFSKFKRVKLMRLAVGRQPGPRESPGSAPSNITAHRFLVEDFVVSLRALTVR